MGEDGTERRTRILDGSPYVRHAPARVSLEEARARGEALYRSWDRRRSVRAFSPDPVPRDLIATAIRAACTGPTGAHQQPYTFVAVSDPVLKARIRQRAEAEERRNYEGGRMPEAWREAIAHLGTDSHKPFLEVAPWLVVLFVQRHGWHDDGSRRTHYYPRESTGIAAGLFIAALHTLGLATLTHTPSPMRFLGEVLDRPSNEQAFLLFPVGYPGEDCWVPDLSRKGLAEVSVWHEAED